MAKIPQEKIDEIRNSVNIVDVIGEYLSLSKKGQNFVAICPFHQDTNPSLSISESKQIYKCFVCNNGGNVFKFLQDYLHIGYVDAVKQVASRTNIDMSMYEVTYQKKIDPTLIPLYEMHEKAAELYRYYLKTKLGIHASEYLKERGFNRELLDEFEIGYAPSTSVLKEIFLKENYDLIDIERTGLVLENSYQSDRFQDRIMFPIWDSEGKVVGFSGRIYRQGDKQAKYMNSPESDIFIKGQILYNLHKARKYAREAGFLYINEGFMDVIAMHKAEHQNCIALMGTALTEKHIPLLKRTTKKIVLCLDGDQAGMHAAYKAMNFLEQYDFTVRIILLPEGHDPDEIYTSQGKQALDSLLKDELTPFEFLLMYELTHLDMRNYDDRSALFDKAVEKIAQITDDKVRDDSINKLSEITHFSRETIENHIPTKKKIEVIPVVKKQVEIVDKYTLAMQSLIYYMLEDKKVALIYQKKLGFMPKTAYRILSSYILDFYRNHPVMDIANLMDKISNDNVDEKKKKILIQLIIKISNLNLPSIHARDSEEAVEDYIQLLRSYSINIKIEQLMKQYKATYDPLRQAEIVQEINNLRKEGNL